MTLAVPLLLLVKVGFLNMETELKYEVSLTYNEMRLLIDCIDWTRQTLYARKPNDFPIRLRESASLGYKLDCTLIDGRWN